MDINTSNECPREWNAATSFSIPLMVECYEYTTIDIFRMIYSRFPVEPSDHIAYHRILFNILEANIMPSNRNYFGNDMYWGTDLIKNNIVEKEAMERYVANEIIEKLTDRYINKPDVVVGYQNNNIVIKRGSGLKNKKGEKISE